MKPNVTVSVAAEREWSKMINDAKDGEERYKKAYKDAQKTLTRERRKHVEYMRKICHYRSKDGNVNVCDIDDGPDRCNKNTLKSCPHYIFVFGGEE